jgi:hypothetical protein
VPTEAFDRGVYSKPIRGRRDSAARWPRHPPRRYKTRAGFTACHLHDVAPNDNARINGSSHNLNMMHHSREL